MILVRPRVATRSPIETGLVCPAVIEIFVTELTAPVGLTEALPGLHAGAMDAARVGYALVTVVALPAILATAITRKFARPMCGTTALPANSSVAVGTRPAFHTGFVAILVTGIVSKEIISRSTKLVAAKAIVIVITGHTDLVLKMGDPCVMFQRLPLATGINHA